MSDGTPKATTSCTWTIWTNCSPTSTAQALVPLFSLPGTVVGTEEDGIHQKFNAALARSYFSVFKEPTLQLNVLPGASSRAKLNIRSALWSHDPPTDRESSFLGAGPHPLARTHVPFPLYTHSVRASHYPTRSTYSTSITQARRSRCLPL
ncbi:hypothetical protein FA13DRAFT_163758 [Coprinellus micaceus]|uniref:Uncharacterized protein n=1 Tax=Coprinellus micaceus TaxID=71717 RepID=A0A4Y7THI8_COPMI|nr:hypothetical protein FA13DRAFT_163758 [Coprinellus micaceus]